MAAVFSSEHQTAVLTGEERHAERHHRNQCPECQLQLSSRQSLYRHWATWHKGKTSQELASYLADYDKHGKAHICPKCGKGFSRLTNLKDHQIKLHGEKDLKRKPRFHCPIPQCSAPPFYFSTSLLQHCEQTHGEQFGKSTIENQQDQLLCKWYIQGVYISLIHVIRFATSGVPQLGGVPLLESCRGRKNKDILYASMHYYVISCTGV